MSGGFMVRAVAITAGLASGCYSGAHGEVPWDIPQAEGVDDPEADSEGTDDGGEDDEGPRADLEPAPPTIHRLTRTQLHNTYLSLLGEPLLLPTELPPDDLLYGFTSIAAAGATVSALGAEQYENAAYHVLDQVWANPVRRTLLVGCDPTDALDPCIETFFAAFAKKAWRRPVEQDEVDDLVALTESLADELGSVDEALEYGAASVLQSPNFLFRIERGVKDDKAPGLRRYTSWEMASRLSYLLLASPPDDELVALAENDALDRADTIEAQALRLLEDPRARPTLVGFFRDFTNIAKLDQLDRSVEQFPQMSETLGPSMRLELERMFETTVFDESGDFRELFTTRKTFVNEDLARIYGIEGVTGPELRPYTFTKASHRAGLLTSAGFLAANAHKTQTSPTHRGRFVRIQLLCQDVPPPPEGVDTSLPEPDPNAPPQTLRERLEVHRENSACAPCHNMMDPIGFAFEHFDAIGAYRDVDEQGLPLDSVTQVDGVDVETAADVGAAIAGLPEAGACIAQRFYEHAGAHLVEKGERESVDELVEAFVASDYDFRALVVAVVVNDGFRYAAGEAE